MQRECLMSRIGPSQTVLPNRISCLCVESIRRIRRTPVFGVRGAASARSALSFRCKQVCLDSFFTRNTLVAGFFLPYFPPSPPGPGRSTPSSHFVSFDSLRFSPKSAYLYLQDPAYAKLRILICVNGVLKHVNIPDSYLRERCANIVDSVRSLA